MAYVRKKKFWAPGHGNLHLSLESYTLCKDGNWHLLDTYNQKQPPLVMPLQVLHPLGSLPHRHGLAWQICQLHALPTDAEQAVIRTSEILQLADECEHPSLCHVRDVL